MKHDPDRLHLKYRRALHNFLRFDDLVRIGSPSKPRNRAARKWSNVCQRLSFRSSGQSYHQYKQMVRHHYRAVNRQ